MSKSLYFLVSFVLLLGLSGAAKAATPIDVNNYSFEFEIEDGNVSRVDCHMGLGAAPNEAVRGWTEAYGGFPDADRWCGVDVDCGDPCACDDCDAWHDLPDGNVVCYIVNDGSYIYQVLDFYTVQGHKYTLMWDGLSWGLDTKASFFYPEDPCVPDVNHVELFSKAYVLNTTQDANGLWLFTRDLKIQFVVLEAASAGKRLGIKLGGTPPVTDSYNWVDNVRVSWEWASTAWDPDPVEDGEDIPVNPVLSWSPGLWAVSDVNGHEVYFGTSESEVADANTSSDPNIYRGSGVGVVSGPDGNNRYSYTVPETLELGKTYYWRIDEVNEGWKSAHGEVPPVNDRWKGEVWSFTTTGLAYNVYPADGATGIPALNLTLRWEAGTGAESHDVYFGTSKSEVADANTNTSGIFRRNQALSEVNYPVEDLLVRKDYFWRIDEVNSITGTFVKGDVWTFKTGIFLVVDNFEFYDDTAALRAVWNDVWYTGGNNGAEVFVETDPNFLRTDDSDQSLKYTYKNFGIGNPATYYGAWAEADATDLEIGTNDWTSGGVKAMVIYFIGDPCNAKDTTWVHDPKGPGGGDMYCVDQMYIALEDGSANEGVVKYDTAHGYDMNDIKDDSWHEWIINLQDFNDAGVALSNVSKVYLGFGGPRVGQAADGAGMEWGYADTVYFDDLRLYPPRCMPDITGLDVLHSLGDITGDGDSEDCNTNYLDLELMARDWASIDGEAMTENRPAVLTDFPAGNSHWTTDCAVGTGAIDVNEGYNIDVEDPRLFGLASMSITAWVKQNMDNAWVGIVSSREKPCSGKGEATELGIYGGQYSGPDGLGYDWSCLKDGWQHDAGLDVPIDGTWTFIAMSVDPTGATLYMKPDSSALQVGTRNEKAHPAQQNFAEGFTIGNDDKEDRAYFKGKIDDVRIYGYALDFNDVNNLAHKIAEPNPPPVYWYKFDETEGLSAADYGTPIEVYSINVSPANLVPKDPNESEDPNLGSNAFDPNNLDAVNFRDYSILAEHWLEQHPWP